MQVLRLFLDIPVRVRSCIGRLSKGFYLIVSGFCRLIVICTSMLHSPRVLVSRFRVTIAKQVPLVRVFRARIGRRIAMADNTSDGAMGGGNSAEGSSEELQLTGMEEDEEAAVIESVL